MFGVLLFDSRPGALSREASDCLGLGPPLQSQVAWVLEALRIHLFGGFLLERGGVALPPIASRAGRSLFAYLVMHRGPPLQRDLLAGSFWPDLPEGRARRRLSHTLWQIQDEDH